MDFCWEPNVSVEERLGLGYVCCCLWCSGPSILCVPGLAFCNNDRFERVVSDTKATVFFSNTTTCLLWTSWSPLPVVAEM
jgi:hypothetical protein